MPGVRRRRRAFRQSASLCNDPNAIQDELAVLQAIELRPSASTSRAHAGSCATTSKRQPLPQTEPELMNILAVCTSACLHGQSWNLLSLAIRRCRQNPRGYAVEQ